MYGVPSGHLEDGEAVTAALLREAAEEAGVLVDAADLRFVQELDVHRDRRGRASADICVARRGPGAPRYSGGTKGTIRAISSAGSEMPHKSPGTPISALVQVRYPVAVISTSYRPARPRPPMTWFPWTITPGPHRGTEGEVMARARPPSAHCRTVPSPRPPQRNRARTALARRAVRRGSPLSCRTAQIR